MVQRLVFPLRRRADLNREAFQRYWREHHAPLVAERAEILGIGMYRQMHTLVDGPTIGSAYDGIAEIRSVRPAADDQARHDAGEELLDDERHFIDLEQSPIWVAPEEVLVLGDEADLRVTAVVTDVAIDLDRLRARLVAAADRRLTTLLQTPDAPPLPLATTRNSPTPPALMVEIWAAPGDEPHRLVDELGTLLTEVGAGGGASTVWCSQRNLVVDRPL